MATSVLNTVLSEGLDLLVTEEENYKPQILAAAKAAGLSAETAVNNLIDSVHVSGIAAAIAPAIKAAVKSAADNAIAKGISEDDILFEAVVAYEKNLADKLAA